MEAGHAQSYHPLNITLRGEAAWSCAPALNAADSGESPQCRLAPFGRTQVDPFRRPGLDPIARPVTRAPLAGVETNLSRRAA